MQLQKLEVQAFLSSHRSILPSLQTIELPDSVLSTTKDLWNHLFLSIALYSCSRALSGFPGSMHLADGCTGIFPRK